MSDEPPFSTPSVRSLHFRASAAVCGTLLAAATSALLLVALQLFLHPYQGLRGDAELYAVQAMARIHPGLASDVFLRFGSQDNYTIFSPIYAWCIGWLGLRNASIALLICSKVLFFIASWSLVRHFSNSRLALVAVSLLVIVDGAYGGYGVFRYAEDWLTARSLAEALSVSALALYLRGRQGSGTLLALLGMLFHPIMAAPCVLVLLCIRCALRVTFVAAVSALTVVLLLSLWVSRFHTGAGLFMAMDAAWLDVVRERSVFLFPSLWGRDDWLTNFRPLLSLSVSALIVRDSRVRRLCLAAALVGVTGLFIALIVGTRGEIAVLIQVQTWRWMWLTSFLSLLLVIPTGACACRAGPYGPSIATLLTIGWMLPPLIGIACMAVAVVLWAKRATLAVPLDANPRWAAAAPVVVIAAGSALALLDAVVGHAGAGEEATAAIGRFWRADGLPLTAMAIVFLVFGGISFERFRRVLPAMALVLVVCCAMALPPTLAPIRRDGALTDMKAFADWRGIIPPTSNVYVAPAHYSAAFSWFTLQRPSYMSVDQSAGVVFSRATAMEIRRRSLVLSPIQKPDWQLRTMDAAARLDAGARNTELALTRENLALVCNDPALGFVVASEDLGMGLVARTPVGPSAEWNLYDCSRIRQPAPRT